MTAITDPQVGLPAALVEDRLALEAWDLALARLLAAAASWRHAQREASEAYESIAEATCAEVVGALWDERTGGDRTWFTPWRSGVLHPPTQLEPLARDVALSLGTRSLIEKAFLISTLYTTLLPPRIRSARGAYNRLLPSPNGCSTRWRARGSTGRAPECSTPPAAVAPSWFRSPSGS